MPRFHSNRRSKPRRRRRGGIGKVKRDIKWLKKNIEFKFKDTAASAVDAGIAGVITPLTLMIQNDTESGRDGQEVTARRIAIRGVIKNINGTPVDTIVRIILFRQINNVGFVLPLISSVLAITGTPDIVNSWRNMQDKNNTKVMFDTTFTMDTLTHSLIPFKLMYRLNHTAKYKGATAIVGNIVTNGLFLVVVSQVTSGANAPTVDFEARYSYVDS